MIVKLVRLDSNANDLPCVDVHAFCGWGIEHVMHGWFGLVVCSRGEPEVCSFVRIAELTNRTVRSGCEDRNLWNGVLYIQCGWLGEID